MGVLAEHMRDYKYNTCRPWDAGRSGMKMS